MVLKYEITDACAFLYETIGGDKDLSSAVDLYLKEINNKVQNMKREILTTENLVCAFL